MKNKVIDKIHEFKKAVIFDLDDTLMPTQHLYYDTKMNIAQKIIEIFGDNIDNKSVMNTVYDIDITNVKKSGLSRLRLPLSMGEAYIHYLVKQNPNKTISIKELNKIYDVIQEFIIEGDKAFSKICKLYKGVSDTINRVKDMGCEVYILTAGDEMVQTYKIYKSGLDKLVKKENIIISCFDKKNALKKYFKEFGYDNCVMVGNSERSDINPALKLGMNAILIPPKIEARKNWSYFSEELVESDKLHITDDIINVSKILEKIFNSNKSGIKKEVVLEKIAAIEKSKKDIG